MVAWVRELCGLQVLGRVNWLRFLSFYSNIYGLGTPFININPINKLHVIDSTYRCGLVPRPIHGSSGWITSQQDSPVARAILSLQSNLHVHRSDVDNCRLILGNLLLAIATNWYPPPLTLEWNRRFQQ